MAVGKQFQWALRIFLQMWHLFLMNQKETLLLYRQSLLVRIWRKLGQRTASLLQFGSLVAALLWRHHRAVNKLKTLFHLSLPPLSLVYSTSLVPTWWCLTDSVWHGHKRGPLSFCWCTVPLESMTTDITSTQGQRGGMTDTKRQWKKRICRRVRRVDTCPVIRHAPHNETLSKH